MVQGDQNSPFLSVKFAALVQHYRDSSLLGKCRIHVQRKSDFCGLQRVNAILLFSLRETIPWHNSNKNHAKKHHFVCDTFGHIAKSEKLQKKLSQSWTIGCTFQWEVQINDCVASKHNLINRYLYKNMTCLGKALITHCQINLEFSSCERNIAIKFPPHWKKIVTHIQPTPANRTSLFVSSTYISNALEVNCSTL